MLSTDTSQSERDSHPRSRKSWKMNREPLTPMKMCSSVLAPVRKLPMELLADVFRLLAISEYGQGALQALSLSQVCHRWQTICVTEPNLWTNIHVDLPSFPCENNSTCTSPSFYCKSGIASPELLLLVLARSKGALRKLHVSVGGAYLHREWKHQKLLGCLLLHATRWETLHGDWSLIPFLGESSANTKLIITGLTLGPFTGSTSHLFAEHRRRNAYQAYMASIPIPCVSISSSQLITRLHLTGRSASEVYFILESCASNLSELTFDEPNGINHGDDDLELVCLTKLKLNLRSGQIIQKLLRGIVAPMLHTLEIEDSGQPIPAGDVVAFLQKAGASVSLRELHFVRCSSEDVIGKIGVLVDVCQGLELLVVGHEHVQKVLATLCQTRNGSYFSVI
ncbi:hypothetical protein DL96DRAFT_1557593 [Flagelloscypha sp. PMI_526]|nr:hypothetical protein DL96DRAFT_1557593 [Flagelloscypha sp. PMI_526]